MLYFIKFASSASYGANAPKEVNAPQKNKMVVTDTNKILERFFSIQNEFEPSTDYDSKFIYLLMDGEEVVYIGVTYDIKKRIGQHSRDKDFTGYYASDRPYSLSDVGVMEHELIYLMPTRYNKESRHEKIKITTLADKEQWAKINYLKTIQGKQVHELVGEAFALLLKKYKQ